MTAIPVRVQLDCTSFHDPEIFGQSPVVNFLEVLGFTYADEFLDESSNDYVYRLHDGQSVDTVLTAEWLAQVTRHFERIDLCATATGYTIVLPVSEREDLTEFA